MHLRRVGRDHVLVELDDAQQALAVYVEARRRGQGVGVVDPLEEHGAGGGHDVCGPHPAAPGLVVHRERLPRVVELHEDVVATEAAEVHAVKVAREKAWGPPEV